MKSLLTLTLILPILLTANGCGQLTQSKAKALDIEPNSPRNIVIVLDATRSWPFWSEAIERIKREIAMGGLKETDASLTLILITNRNFRLPAPIAEKIPISKAKNGEMNIDFLRVRNRILAKLDELTVHPPNLPAGTDLLGALYEAQDVLKDCEAGEEWLLIFSDLGDTVGREIELNFDGAIVRCFYVPPQGNITRFEKLVKDWSDRFLNWQASSVQIYNPTASRRHRLLE